MMTRKESVEFAKQIRQVLKKYEGICFTVHDISQYYKEMFRPGSNRYYASRISKLLSATRIDPEKYGWHSPHKGRRKGDAYVIIDEDSSPFSEEDIRRVSIINGEIALLIQKKQQHLNSAKSYAILLNKETVPEYRAYYESQRIQDLAAAGIIDVRLSGLMGGLRAKSQ